MPWSVVLPVKALEHGKSRLLPASDPWRGDLAMAFLGDVLIALAGAACVSELLVVSDDPLVRDLARQSGAQPIDEGGQGGINPAATKGIGHASPGQHVAVMVADLPCIDAHAVDFVLGRAIEVPRSFVCDAAGTGTTMLMAVRPSLCTPGFGTRSRARHAASGYVELGQPSQTARAEPGLVDAFRRARRDVDTAIDLWDAVRIGVGPSTRATLLQRGPVELRELSSEN